MAIRVELSRSVAYLSFFDEGFVILQQNPAGDPMARPSLREKLATSAVDTLHTHGFRGCSIQDITEAAGVPKGSFFNHFENKEDLAIDALRRYLQNSRADIL